MTRKASATAIPLMPFTRRVAPVTLCRPRYARPSRKPVPRAGGPLAGGAWAAAAGIAAIRAAEPRKVSASSTKAPVTPTKLRIVPPPTPGADEHPRQELHEHEAAHREARAVRAAGHEDGEGDQGEPVPAKAHGLGQPEQAITPVRAKQRDGLPDHGRGRGRGGMEWPVIVAWGRRSGLYSGPSGGLGMASGYKVRLGDGSEIGPMDLEALKTWYTQGLIGRDSPVLKPGSQRWSTLAQVVELKNVGGPARSSGGGRSQEGEIYEEGEESSPGFTWADFDPDLWRVRAAGGIFLVGALAAGFFAWRPENAVAD